MTQRELKELSDEYEAGEVQQQERRLVRVVDPAKG